VEGKLADQQRVEYDPTAPNVHGGSLIALFSDDLGSSVVDAPAGSLEQSSVLHEVGQPKIYNFDNAICIDEYIFGFEVAVGDEVAMRIGQSLYELSEEELRLIL
jgi:hypothetical protein